MNRWAMEHPEEQTRISAATWQREMPDVLGDTNVDVLMDDLYPTYELAEKAATEVEESTGREIMLQQLESGRYSLFFAKDK